MPAYEEEDGHGQKAKHLNVLSAHPIDEEDGQPIAGNAYTMYVCMYVCMYVYYIESRCMYVCLNHNFSISFTVRKSLFVYVWRIYKYVTTKAEVYVCMYVWRTNAAKNGCIVGVLLGRGLDSLGRENQRSHIVIEQAVRIEVHILPHTYIHTHIHAYTHIHREPLCR